MRAHVYYYVLDPRLNNVHFMLKFNLFPHIQVGISTGIIISTADSKERTLMKGTEIQMGFIEPIMCVKVPRD